MPTSPYVHSRAPPSGDGDDPSRAVGWLPPTARTHQLAPDAWAACLADYAVAPASAARERPAGHDQPPDTTSTSRRLAHAARALPPRQWSVDMGAGGRRALPFRRSVADPRGPPCRLATRRPFFSEKKRRRREMFAARGRPRATRGKGGAEEISSPTPPGQVGPRLLLRKRRAASLTGLVAGRRCGLCGSRTLADNMHRCIAQGISFFFRAARDFFCGQKSTHPLASTFLFETC